MVIGVAVNAPLPHFLEGGFVKLYRLGAYGSPWKGACRSRGFLHRVVCLGYAIGSPGVPIAIGKEGAIGLIGRHNNVAFTELTTLDNDTPIFLAGGLSRKAEGPGVALAGLYPSRIDRTREGIGLRPKRCTDFK